LAQEKQEMYPKIHSGKLSEKEMQANGQEWALFILVKKTFLQFVLRQLMDWLSRLQHDMTCVR
jgi:hypothetical protein